LTVSLAFWGLMGCASPTDAPQPASPSNLRAYDTRTPAVTPSPTLPATEIPSPSPTPVLYSILGGDTISAIAGRFGVSIETLLAANPGIAPEALSIGQTITIPSGAPGVVSGLLVTPAPPDMGPVFCQLSGGGTACLVPVHNPYPEALENIKIQVTLFDGNGQSIGSQDAILPCNRLLHGQALPAATFFSGIVAQTSAQAQLIDAVRLPSDDARYLSASIQNLAVSIDWNGQSAHAQGQVTLPDGSRPAAVLWVAAVAYDSAGNMIGYRRWEWSGTLQAGASQPFELSVYSLGPLISRVDLLVEARP